MLGFSLLKNSFQFVDIHYQEGKPVVNQFAKKATNIPFTPTSLLNDSLKSDFRKLIEEAINFYKLEGPVILSIDSQVAMIRKVLIDLTIPESEIEEQIEWEVNQIVPKESMSEFLYVYETLPSGYYEAKKAFLLVVFRKEILEAVKKLFLDTPLSIQFIELDIFSAFNGANRLFGIREQDLCFIADLRRDVIKFLAARKGDFFDSCLTSPNNDSEEQEANKYDSAEDLANHMDKEIRRKLLEYQIEPEGNPIETLFLYGENSNLELAKHLEDSNLAKEIVILEPFNKLELNPEIDNLSEKGMRSHEYSSCIGSALRSAP